MNLPATRLSAMLYSCWNTMLPNSGMQNRQSTLSGFPTVRSRFICIRPFVSLLFKPT